jgi:hypothetical protein
VLNRFVAVSTGVLFAFFGRGMVKLKHASPSNLETMQIAI